MPVIRPWDDDEGLLDCVGWKLRLITEWKLLTKQTNNCPPLYSLFSCVAVRSSQRVVMPVIRPWDDEGLLDCVRCKRRIITEWKLLTIRQTNNCPPLYSLFSCVAVESPQRVLMPVIRPCDDDEGLWDCVGMAESLDWERSGRNPPDSGIVLGWL